MYDDALTQDERDKAHSSVRVNVLCVEDSHGCHVVIGVGSNGECDLHPQEHPIVDKFVSMIFNHSITEFWISYESIMDSLEILFLASFLQLVSRKVFPVSQLFTISMSMRSSFLDDVLRN